MIRLVFDTRPYPNFNDGLVVVSYRHGRVISCHKDSGIVMYLCPDLSESPIKGSCMRTAIQFSIIGFTSRMDQNHSVRSLCLRRDCQLKFRQIWLVPFYPAKQFGTYQFIFNFFFRAQKIQCISFSSYHSEYITCCNICTYVLCVCVEIFVNGFQENILESDHWMPSYSFYHYKYC